MQLDKELDDIVNMGNKKKKQYLQKKMKDKLENSQKQELKIVSNFLSKIGVFLIFGLILLFTVKNGFLREMPQKLDDNKNELKIVDEFDDDFQVIDPGNITTFISSES